MSVTSKALFYKVLFPQSFFTFWGLTDGGSVSGSLVCLFL
jgi:hypothetical protein